jgi:hypothetical protein
MDLDSEVARRAERQRERVMAMFSGSFMSDTKWRTLFKALCVNRDLIWRCSLKEVGREQASQGIENPFPSVQDFGKVFWERGIDEVIWPIGFIRYSDIEWIAFPRRWTVAVGRLVPPKTVEQAVDRIAGAIREVGLFETRLDDAGLTLFGYR